MAQRSSSLFILLACLLLDIFVSCRHLHVSLSLPVSYVADSGRMERSALEEKPFRLWRRRFYNSRKEKWKHKRWDLLLSKIRQMFLFPSVKGDGILKRMSRKLATTNEVHFCKKHQHRSATFLQCLIDTFHWVFLHSNSGWGSWVL